VFLQEKLEALNNIGNINLLKQALTKIINEPTIYI